MEGRRPTALVLVALTLLVSLCMVTSGVAQQSSAGQPTARKATSTNARTSATRYKVPDNPSPHPAPEQPIPYSHKQHLAFGLKCQECHTNPEPGKLMTFPDTAKCRQCHVTIGKNNSSKQKMRNRWASNHHTHGCVINK